MKAGNQSRTRTKFRCGLILLFMACPVSSYSQDPSEKEFLASLEFEQRTLFQLIDSDPAERMAAALHTQTHGYSEHIEKYLSYYRTWKDDDVLRTVFDSKQIKLLEQKTRKPFENLLNELFDRKKLDGVQFFRFFLFPEEFLKSSIVDAISISGTMNWLSLFDELKKSLPPEFPYKTQLRIDGQRPGGSYNSEGNEIVFGSYPPNFSTVLGFIHEFGHSVFLIPDTRSPKLQVLAANEAYAEMWASQILNFPFAAKILRSPLDHVKIKKYLRFRDLISLRFHLFVLEMDRDIRSSRIRNSEQYRVLSRKLSEKYLLMRNFPAVLPAMPQMRTPGYLQTYLAIPFLKIAYLRKVQSDVVQSLIDLGPVILSDIADSEFDEILKQSVTFCFSSTIEKCLEARDLLPQDKEVAQ